MIVIHKNTNTAAQMPTLNYDQEIDVTLVTSQSSICQSSRFLLRRRLAFAVQTTFLQQKEMQLALLGRHRESESNRP